MYDHLLFDADGTLFNFEAAEKWALSHVLEELGIDPSDEAIDTYSRINNGVWLEFEQGLITMDRLKTERFRRFYSRYGLQGDPGLTAQRYTLMLSRSCRHRYPRLLHRGGYQ
jgi:FMN phosphatase YigB (HAD superfamily)